MKDIKEFPHTVWQQERKQWVLSVFIFHTGPVKKQTLFLLSGIADSKEEIENVFEKYNTSDKVKNALEETRIYWKKTGKR